MDHFYLDCTGLNYEGVLDIQISLKDSGIESNISTGSLCVHTTTEYFRLVKPDLQTRILDKGEQTFAAQMSDAFKAEQWNK